MSIILAIINGKFPPMYIKIATKQQCEDCQHGYWGGRCMLYPTYLQLLVQWGCYYEKTWSERMEEYKKICEQ